jgi:hypothetical protein
VSEWSDVVAVVPVDAVRHPVSGIPPSEGLPHVPKKLSQQASLRVLEPPTKPQCF